MERVDGIEPTTNSLEDCDSTTELHPQLEDPVGLEPTALGLKVPCTTYCATASRIWYHTSFNVAWIPQMVNLEGLEPSANGLRVRYSTN